VERCFGTSEHLWQLRKSMRSLCQFETRFGSVVPVPRPGNTSRPLYFDQTHPETCSPMYAEALAKVWLFFS
jgi:hypothetical protein